MTEEKKISDTELFATLLHDQMLAAPLITNLTSGTTLKKQFPSTFWSSDAKFAFTLSLQDTTHNTTQNEINELYSQVYGTIANALGNAEKEDKKLVVLIGENHFNRSSLLANILIHSAAIELGINTSMHEFKQSDINNFVVHLEQTEHKHIIYNSLTPNSEPSLRFVFGQNSHKKYISIIGADPLHPTLKSSISENPNVVFFDREKETIEIIDYTQEHCLYVCGSAHLGGLKKEDLPESTQLLVFNTSQVRAFYDDKAAKSFYGGELVRRTEYASNEGPRDGNVTMVIIPGRGPETAEEALEMADGAREYAKNQPPTAWGGITSKAAQTFEQERSSLSEALKALAAKEGHVIDGSSKPKNQSKSF